MPKAVRITVYFLLELFFLHSAASAQASGSLGDCRAHLQQDTLILGNRLIERRYLWNHGHLESISLSDLARRKTWRFSAVAPDCNLPGAGEPAGDGVLAIESVGATTVSPAHLLVKVTASFPSLQLLRQFRIYPECPAIACDYFIKGTLEAEWTLDGLRPDQVESIESLSKQNKAPAAPVIERLAPGGSRWNFSVVRFYDRTDINNTLAETHTFPGYTRWSTAAGNLLFAEELIGGQSIFILKEAPCSDVQLANAGADFLVRNGEFMCLGLGVQPGDLIPGRWLRCYGFVTGVSGADETSRLKALRTYQQNIRIRKAGRDLMIMMNTWGDRNRDAKLGEAFALKELEAGARLGISHFQLDDGWQSGISKNSAYGTGSWQDNWVRKDYWQVHPEKFPNGLAPVISRARELGIEICLWFNPSSQDNYLNWEADAAALIELHRQYGIRTFKIDGVLAPCKTAEVNFRSFLDRVTAATDGEAVFNLDVTAGRRMGYHYFTEYGNLFLENRYTDWGNYYPHWTLRNLWMLSRYVPPQSLQIEFLNLWRNQKKYADADPLAPHRIPFEYAFAVTMMAQPLAWFEASGLPEEAMMIAPVVKKYRALQEELHGCQIFPIGAEPSGGSWSGFQAFAENSGFFLIYRENHENARFAVKTRLQPGQKVRCKALLGQGDDFSATVDEQARLIFELPAPFTYGLYRYAIR